MNLHLLHFQVVINVTGRLSDHELALLFFVVIGNLAQRVLTWSSPG